MPTELVAVYKGHHLTSLEILMRTPFSARRLSSKIAFSSVRSNTPLAVAMTHWFLKGRGNGSRM